MSSKPSINWHSFLKNVCYVRILLTSQSTGQWVSPSVKRGYDLCIMTVLLIEDFEGDWTSTWGGQPRNGYPTNQGNDPDKEARLLIREGEHYGSDFRKPTGQRLRRGRISYDLYLSGDWNPTGMTGKLPGVADFSYEPVGYGNNKPNPDGCTIRTLFGPNRQVGLYVYHQDQQNTWGDGLYGGTVPLWKFVPIVIEWDFDAGWVKQRVGDYAQVGMSISVSANTAIDTAWLCAYIGGSGLAPSNMAADIDNFVVESIEGISFAEIAVELRRIEAELKDLADRVA